MTLPAEEIELLRRLPVELRPLLEAPRDSGDPVKHRLWPAAYANPLDEDAEQEWQELVHPDLVTQRVAALELLAATLERAGAASGEEGSTIQLSDDEATAWLGALNDARLAIGTRLDVRDDDLEGPPTDPAHPDAPAWALYGWLTALQGDLVEALVP